MPLRVVRSAALVFGVLLGATGVSTAQTAVGTVKKIEGQPQLVSASGSRPAQVGSPVYEGDRLATQRGAALGLTMVDGTQLAVGPESSVTVQTFRYDAVTREGAVLVDIARGALRMVSGLIAGRDPSAVNVKTPTSVIGIRGTDFLVDVGNPAAVQ